MPHLVNLHDRATVDLHAPWWSPKTDEAGRYLERVVIYAEMTEHDEQVISRAIAPVVSGKSRNADISLKESALARAHTLMQLIVELTDETGRPFPKSPDTIKRLPRRDSEWIMDQIGELNAAPVVKVLPEDEDDAEMNADGSAGSLGSDGDDAAISPAEIAQRRFRRPR
jgi:hypothetical protein